MDRGHAASAPGASRPSRWVERLIVGALLGAAVFMLEAGLGQIALHREVACREALASQRIGAPEASCLPEVGVAATRSLAFGPGGRLFPDSAPLAAWLFSAGVYAALGAVCAQLTPGWGVGVFLGMHALLLGAVTFFTYIAKYVTF